LSNMRSMLELILRNDAEFCGSDVTPEDKVIDDENLVEMVNSILYQFGRSKQRHLKDVQHCLAEMEDLQKKKVFYKKLWLKMKEKNKVLVEENEELKAKLNEQAGQLQKETEENNNLKEEKLKLEGAIGAKDKQILKLTEQFKTKHKEFQKKIDQLREGIEEKFEVVQKDKNKLAKQEAELRERLAMLEAENQDLKLAETNLKNDVSFLQCKISDDKLGAKVKILEGQILSKDKEIEDLKQEVKNGSKRSDDHLRRGKFEFQKMKTALEKEAAKQQSLIKDLQLRISEQQHQRDFNFNNNSSRSSDVAKLRSELDEKN